MIDTASLRRLCDETNVTVPPPRMHETDNAKTHILADSTLFAHHDDMTNRIPLHQLQRVHKKYVCNNI